MGAAWCRRRDGRTFGGVARVDQRQQVGNRDAPGSHSPGGMTASYAILDLANDRGQFFCFQRISGHASSFLRLSYSPAARIPRLRW